MLFSNLVHLKPLLMVLTAAVGAVAGGTMVNSYVNSPSRYATSFLLTLDPTSITIDQGGSAISAVTVASINGFSGTVALSLFYPDQRFSATLNPASVNVPANGNAKSTLTITAPTNIGNYSVVVIGLASSHGRTSYASSMLSLQVVSSMDFTITATPSSLIGLAGATNTTTITVTSLSGFAGNVNLTATTPFGYITVTGTQNPLTLSAGGTASSRLIITTSEANTAPGTYTVLVTGTTGSHTHTTTITVTAYDPTFTETLVRSSFEFINGTTLTLNLQNTGNTTITLQSYIVKDSSGNAWSLTNWQGPVLAPNTGGTAIITIGSSCSSCIYTGITGLFFQFNTGQTYTVTVTTARNSQFSFTVTR